MYDFRWNDWNVDHIGKHGVSWEDAEYVVNRAKRPYPEYRGVDPQDVVYVVHARPLTDAEKKRYRRRRR